MLRRFRLEEPETLKDASDLLAKCGETAKVYAGGTELLLAMKENLVHYDFLINIKKIPSLDHVTSQDGAIHIGALVTHNQLARSPLLQERFRSFAQMERNVANIRVREAGTIGGNLCFAEPHADPGTVLLALDARMVAAKSSSKREIAAESFFLDAYETCLEPDEILTEIKAPWPSENSAFAYLKFGYLERPTVGVAVFITLADQGKSLAEARIAIGCAGPKPMRAGEAEELLRGKGLDEASTLITRAGEIAGAGCGAISDLHGSQEYKEHIVQVLLKRAFGRAREECLGNPAS